MPGYYEQGFSSHHGELQVGIRKPIVRWGSPTMRYGISIRKLLVAGHDSVRCLQNGGRCDKLHMACLFAQGACLKWQFKSEGSFEMVARDRSFKVLAQLFHLLDQEHLGVRTMTNQSHGECLWCVNPNMGSPHDPHGIF